MPPLRYSTKPIVPVEALELNEDIMRLEQCRKLLWQVSLDNITQDKELALRIMQATSSQLRMCERYARGKMLRLYLDPRKKKI